MITTPINTTHSAEESLSLSLFTPLIEAAIFRMSAELQNESRQPPIRATSMDDLRLDLGDDSQDDSGFFSLPHAKSTSNINASSTPSGKRRGRRRPRPGSRSLEEDSKVLKSPPRLQQPRPKFLARFLSSSKRNNNAAVAAATSTTNSTGSGDTVSNTADPDNTSLSPEQVFENQNNNSSSNNSLASPMFRSLTQIVRRNTMDTTGSPLGPAGWLQQQASMSSHGGGGKMSPQDYQLALESMRTEAKDLQDQGKTELAIEMWQEALEFAEEQQDTSTDKTEMLCNLVQLHLKLAHAQEVDTCSMSDDELNLDEQENHQRMAKRQSQLIRPGLLETFHHQTAKRYLHRIKPASVQPDWFGPPSRQLMEFFNQVEAWELAIIIADQLLFQEGQEQGHEILATMHYQVASQKLDAQRNAEALQHLQATVTYLQKVPTEQRDMVLYLQVLHLLATEYQAQHEYDSAMEIYKEQMLHTAPKNRAGLFCQMAQNYLARGKLDTALEQIDFAKNSPNIDDDILSQILQIKGDVYFKLGRMEESLECYQQALHEVESSPADKAKLLYTMGRLCVRLGRVRSAITYFSRELEITKQELGQNHLSVSRVLHQLAKLYDEGLGEHKMALLKYNKALAVELSVLQECHAQVTNCVNCNPVTHRMCSRHGNMQRQISSQIRETKRCQGRVHYKLGDLERAMQTSFSELSPRGRRSRRHTLR